MPRARKVVLLGAYGRRWDPGLLHNEASGEVEFAKLTRPEALGLLGVQVLLHCVLGDAALCALALQLAEMRDARQVLQFERCKILQEV